MVHLRAAWLGRLRLRTRLLIVGLLLQVVALGLMGLAAMALVDEHLRRETQQRIEQFGPFMNAALATPMAQRDYASVAAILVESRQARGFEFLIVTDASGRMIAQDGEPGPDESRAVRMIENEVRLELSGQSLGQVRFGLSNEPITRTRAEAARLIAAITLLVLSVCSALLVWLDTTLTRPLRQLEAAARDIHAGNYEISLPVHRQDDLGMLMRAFDRMRREIDRKVSDLTKSESLQRRYLAESIDQQGRTEQALRVAEQANRTKADFIANMSHEIRTPMNAIIGLTDLSLETPLSSQQREYLSLVRASADHLLVIINDILDFSKIDAGRVQIEARPFVVRDVAGSIVALHTAAARVKGVALGLQVSPEVPAVLLGDALRIGQVLNNLLANAVKFTERGQISLQIHAEVSGQEAQVHFSIRDSGIGIPPDKLRDIFEPFLQADNSITRRFGGTGLGLTISRKLAQGMGGEITVHSVEALGSVFTLSLGLPIVSESERSASDLSASDASDASSASDASDASSALDKSGAPGRLCVLLVEDNPVNRVLAQTLLEQAGHRVITAEDGRAGLQAWAQGGIDVVLMDVQMPVLDGLSATRELREIERQHRRARTPVVAMTANAMSGDRERCLEAGMDDYIAKPFRRDELAAALARASAARVIRTIPADAS